MIIERPNDAAQLNQTKKWVLLYGRRKTGKTFLVRHFTKYNEYFFVKKDRTVLATDQSLSYDTFIEIVKRSIVAEKTIVIDEFHRLGDDFFELLHSMEKKGKIILVSSTLALSKKLLSARSALLGLFVEVPLSIIRLSDCLNALHKKVKNKKELVERALFLQEPLVIDYMLSAPNARTALSQALRGSLHTIPALTGEVFTEEGRRISAIYEGILRAIACGKSVSGEISSYLFSRKLIAKDDPSIIQQYFNNLLSFGLIKRVPVYKKNMFFYKHTSPLSHLFYYADEKYNLSEASISDDEMTRIADEVVPHLIEDAIRAFLAERLGLREAVAHGNDYEIDACLLRFNKPVVGVEIKWKKTITVSDIKAAENNLKRLPFQRSILFVPDKKGLTSDTLEIVDIEDIMKWKSKHNTKKILQENQQ
jgi:uncharacterized protein